MSGEEPKAASEPTCIFCRICDELRKSEACRHLMNARKEVLLAVRACIDEALKRIEERQAEGEPQKIPVE
ncbi:MAG: hypothetical protein ACE5O2_11540 [Armatimonadota bacterium]